MRRAVFLDRDGVLNELVPRGHRAHSPWTTEELRLVGDAAPACAALQAAGYLLIVVTNQPDVARGKTTRQIVEWIHQTIRVRIGVDDVRVCYHDDADRCGCRKPAPGLLLAAATDHDVDLRHSFMVGDRWKDIEAGRRAGCRTVLIERDDSGIAPWPHADFVTRSLRDAAHWIIGEPDQDPGADRSRHGMTIG